MEEFIIFLICIIVIPLPFVILYLILSYHKKSIISEIKKLNVEILKIRKDIEDLKTGEKVIIREKEEVIPTNIQTEQKQEEPREDISRWSKPVASPVSIEEEIVAEQEAPEIKETEEVQIPEKIIQEIIPDEVPGQMLVNADLQQELEPEIEKVPEPVEEITIPPFAATHDKYEKSEKQEKPPRDFEKYFGVNLLSKIGIATLVLGIAYFVKYAIDQNWINEIGRVAIGILSGATLILTAHRLRKNYHTFSSILIGGGISVLYITIALAFWDYELFSQEVSFAFLIIITILSVFLSIVYDRQELAIFSLLGGFASPMIVSSGSGNYVVLFSYILILNTGMLILAYKKHWKSISIISYILTQGFYWVWLLTKFTDEYIGATTFILLFFIQFYLLAMFDFYHQKKKISPFQVAVILGNNLSLFGAGLYIFYDLDIDVNGIITISIACMNAIPMVILFKNKIRDNNMLYLLIAIVLTFVSLAIPVQLEGCAITMFWAAESVILLWLFNKSSIKIFQIGFILIETLVAISLMMDWQKFYNINFNDDELSIVLNRPFITGIVVLASNVINIWLYRKNKSLWKNDTEITGTILKFWGILLLFLVPFFELNYQLHYYYSSGYFINLVLGVYCFSFAGGIALYRWKKENWLNITYPGLLLTILIYSSVYLYIIYEVREDILFETLSGWSYFAIHYLTYPAIIITYIFLIKRKNYLNKLNINPDFIYWFTTITTTIILSLEMGNTLVMCFSDTFYAEDILFYSQTIGYPVLWGMIALILMLLGMKNKNRSLRIISLSLSILIIGKLYLYDVWKMNQTGRIIAFIFLGLLFLLVSFLYQKLKILLQKEEEKEEGKE